MADKIVFIYVLGKNGEIYCPKNDSKSFVGTFQIFFQNGIIGMGLMYDSAAGLK